MNLLRKVKSGLRYIFNKDYRFLINCNLGLYDKMSDEEYLKRKFKTIFGYELNLNEPKTFNEKLQWLKLYNRRVEYAMMSDKYLVREYVAKTIGEKYLIPLLGVWNSPNEIDFDKLPNQFVLKCNHNSGLGMCICKDKSKLNVKKVKRELAKGLKENYYLHNREWQYKNIPRKIICEQYLKSDDGKELTDYKFFCFNGEPKIMYVAKDNSNNPTTDFFDMDYNHISIRMRDPNASEIPQKPKCFDQMKEYAKILSKGIPHARIDMYEVDGKVYFGEITFFHCGGFSFIHPKEWDDTLGNWIILPNEKL